MLKRFQTHSQTINNGNISIPADMDICQSDYPLDWYQEDFIPYAQEYQALPDRKPATIIKWMEKYLKPAIKYFGDDLMLLAHYYMGGEIVKLIQHFGGNIGDSYQLALAATENLDKKIIIESAVHFMAESISILADEQQQVYITNPKSGCTMELLAKDFMVEPALLDLNERYGEENILPVCYMNTSGRIKAMTGAQAGATCTSSNVKKIFQWALTQNKKILFIPDKNMGENVAAWCGVKPEQIAYWPGGSAGATYNLMQQSPQTLQQFDNAKIVLFSSLCAVHDYYRADMVHYWQQRGYHVIAHPESRPEVINVSDSWGSTAFIWQQVTEDKAGTKKYAVATENHMVQNLKQHCSQLGIDVVNLGEAKSAQSSGVGCGCATMSRNDPPHLVALLDQLRLGNDCQFNLVRPGDIVNEVTGVRKRLDQQGQQWIIDNAKLSLQKMIELT